VKAEKIFRKSLYFTFVLFVLGLLAGNPCFSKEIKKVAVLPFVMNTQQDLTFLQKGIFDMFSSRISYGDEVEVFTRETLENRLGSASPSFSIEKGINESQAKKLGTFLNVDYVLYGSLTLFGNSMSLDVNMVDIKMGNPTLTFFRQDNEAGSVIPELNKIAEEINYKVFGRETLAFQSQMAMQKAYQGEGEAYVSPLKKFQTLLSVNGGTLNGVATGDLDGDKKNEIVVIQDKIIQIFKYAFNGKLKLLETIEDSRGSAKIVSVDVADINSNGYSEIFITRMNNKQESISSYVVEYNGSNYVKGKIKYPWYFRVIKNYRDNTSLLYAQVHTKEGPWVTKDVFRLSWQDNSYRRETSLRVPKKGFSILSMTSGTGINKDETAFLYTNQLGQLIIFSDTGRVDWASDKGYGGSRQFYELPQIGSDNQKSFVFLQPKNILYDMDSDGKPELFVIKNTEASDHLFQNTKVFKKGSIEIFNFNEMGISYENAPKKFPGPVTNIDIGDYDNDGKMELLVTVQKKGNAVILKNTKSLLVAYDLD
jgi:TolB-like protein